MSAVVAQIKISQTFGIKIPLKISVTTCALDSHHYFSPEGFSFDWKWNYILCSLGNTWWNPLVSCIHCPHITWRAAHTVIQKRGHIIYCVWVYTRLLTGQLLLIHSCPFLRISLSGLWERTMVTTGGHPSRTWNWLCLISSKPTMTA